MRKKSITVSSIGRPVFSVKLHDVTFLFLWPCLQALYYTVIKSKIQKLSLFEPYLNQGGQIIPSNNTGTPGFSDLPTALSLIIKSNRKLPIQIGNGKSAVKVMSPKNRDISFKFPLLIFFFMQATKGKISCEK